MACPTSAATGYTENPCGLAPVKNTFIHYDFDEQPDYRKSASTPADVDQRDGWPAFVSLPGKVEEMGPTTGTNNIESNEDDISMPNSIAKTTVLTESAPVKNTFIHFDDNDQPDYRTTKSVPAKVERIMGEPAWVPISEVFEEAELPSPRGGHADVLEPIPELAAEDPSLGKCDAGIVVAASPLPSIGSSSHAQGTCRPCAHNWKPGGCAKGELCTFCHLCVEDDFKRRRKEKLIRLKAERMRRREEAAALGLRAAGDESDGEEG